MLAVLEKRLYKAVKNANGKSVETMRGPLLAPESCIKPMVAISVSKLNAYIPANVEDVQNNREQARISRICQWVSDGKGKKFTLPGDENGAVEKVEAPPGRPCSSGDDYYLEGRTVRFYQPPAKGDPGVMAIVSKGKARGYRETRPCRVWVCLCVWAETLERADALFSKSFQTLLAASMDIGNIKMPVENIDNGVIWGLLDPVTVLESIEREAVNRADRVFYCVTAHIRVFGELEITVALGAEEDAARIDKIEPFEPMKGVQNFVCLYKS